MSWWGLSTAGWVFGLVGGIIAGPVVAAVGGTVFVVAGVAGVFSGGSQPQHEHVIDDAVWKKRWDSIWQSTVEKATSAIHATAPTNTAARARSSGKSEGDVAEQKRKEEEERIFKKAIETGYVNMGFGQIIVFGIQEDHKVSVLRDVIGVHDIGLEEHVNLVMHEDKFYKMTKDEEVKEMALLAKKVVEKNPNCILKEIIDSVEVVKVAFKPDNVTKAIKPEQTVDAIISKTVRTLICNLKKEDGSSSDVSETSSSLLHVSDCAAFGFLENVIPAFITARSIFFLLSPTCSGCASSVSEAEKTGQVSQWIAYIHSGVTTMANKYKKVLESESESYPPRYPKIFVIGTRADESTITRQFCQGAQSFITMIIIDGSLSGNQKVKELEKEAKESVKGLVLPVPLAWEFFRKILHELKENKPYISVEKVAALALLCGIKLENLQSVLNFYHEHGAILYYPAVDHLQNIVILNPKWFLKQFQHLYDLTKNTSPPNMSFKTKGILAENACIALWKKEEFGCFSQGIITLMTTLHLATPITKDNVPPEMCDVNCKLYFVPSVLDRRSSGIPSRGSGVCYAARLHLTFTSIYVPPGCYVRLVSKLLEDERLKVDFYAEIYRDQISFVYGIDRITIFTTPTSICVDLIREKSCSENHCNQNFPITCQNILSLLNNVVKEILKQSFGNIQTHPAFPCECQPEPHFVHITTETEYSSSVRCQKYKLYTYNKEEQFWLKMKTPAFNESCLSEFELRQLIQNVSHQDFVRIAQALEISSNLDASCKYRLIKHWCDTMGPNARAHLLFHLRHLDLELEAINIEHGINYGKPISQVYQDTPELKDLMNLIAAVKPAKWRLVGIQLGLEIGILDGIAAQLSRQYGLQECFREVLIEWKNRMPSPYTWMTIIDVLETPSVGEMALAEEIKEWLNASPFHKFKLYLHRQINWYLGFN